MANLPKDARLRELQFLANIERTGSYDNDSTYKLDTRERGMIAHLIYEGCLNGVGLQSLSYQHNFADMKTDLVGRIDYDRWSALTALLSGQRVMLRLTHKGLVRLSELQQALQTGRDREPFGILLGQRHVQPDLVIALAATDATSPLSVAYLDANGFKAINDTINHAAGDEALRILMSVVASITEGRGEAYRAGGDELVVIAPNTSGDLALTTMRAVAAQIHKEKMPGSLPLSVSCGIVTTGDPAIEAADLLKRADEQQKRAKARSRVNQPRPTVIAVEGQELEVIP